MAVGGIAVDCGTGTAVVFGTTTFASQLLGLTINGISRASIETAHMETAAAGEGTFGNATSIPAQLSDPGEMVMEVHFNPDTEPPIDQPAETITITWPLVVTDASAATWAFSGFATNFDAGVPFEDKMTGTLTVKISGNITIVQTVVA